MIWAAFKAASLSMKAIAIGSVLVVIVTSYGIWHHKIWERGYARALSDIAKQDAKAVARATALRSTWRDCRDRGGVWDQSTGKCGR